jgi:hypothetical protein
MILILVQLFGFNYDTTFAGRVGQRLSKAKNVEKFLRGPGRRRVAAGTLRQPDNPVLLLLYLVRRKA